MSITKVTILDSRQDVVWMRLGVNVGDRSGMSPGASLT